MSDQKLIQEIHQIVIEMRTILLGVNGDDGMAGDVHRLQKGHTKLAKEFWILVSFLIGSGVIGGAGLLMRLLSGGG